MTTGTFYSQTISLIFDRCWRDVNSYEIPDDEGIYLVYVGTYNSQKDTFMLRKLIYIGEAAKVRGRIENHEKRARWEQYLERGEELCYSYANITNPDRERAEAALIFQHKPPVNQEYTTSFPFDGATVKSCHTDGSDCAQITPCFTVRQTP